MKIRPVRVAFHDPKTGENTKLDLFRDAKVIETRYGRRVYATAVEQALDLYEGHIRDKGVVYYDTKQLNPPIILHNRAALLAAFVRDGQIGRPTVR